MNFKKTYKEANDSIHADKNLINTIFEKAEKKTSFFAMYSKQLTACAAAVVLVCIIGMLPYVDNLNSNNSTTTKSVAVKNNNDDKTKKDRVERMNNAQSVSSSEIETIKEKPSTGHDDAKDKNENNSTEDNNTDAVMIALESSDATENIVETSEESYLSGNSSGGSSALEKTSEDSSRDAEEVSLKTLTINENAENVPASPRNNSDNSSSNKASAASSDGLVVAGGHYPSVGSGGGSVKGGGGGGGFSANIATLVSFNEYSEHLGTDIKKFFNALPDGFAFQNTETVSVIKDGNGNIVKDYALFNAINTSDAQKVITLTVSSDSNDISFGSGKNINLNGFNVNYISNSLYNSVSFKYKNIYISISSNGLDEDIFMNYISSVLN